MQKNIYDLIDRIVTSTEESLIFRNLHFGPIFEKYNRSDNFRFGVAEVIDGLAKDNERLDSALDRPTQAAAVWAGLEE